MCDVINSAWGFRFGDIYTTFVSRPLPEQFSFAAGQMAIYANTVV